MPSLTHALDGQVELDPSNPLAQPSDLPYGLPPLDRVDAVAGRLAAAQGLRLRGLMCVAPRGVDPAAAFARLAQLGARLRADHPEADVLSMGMSADLEAAVAAGATHVRIGSDILGPRGPVG